jgi:hypothetical protein
LKIGKDKDDEPIFKKIGNNIRYIHTVTLINLKDNKRYGTVKNKSFLFSKILKKNDERTTLGSATYLLEIEDYFLKIKLVVHKPSLFSNFYHPELYCI